jgi:3-keto-disaccharide hydrolase
MIKLVAGFILVTVLACNNNAGSGNTNNADTAKSNTAILSMDTLTEQEKSDGWQLLFDGQTAKGWHKYGNEPVGSAWKIVDGAFYFDTSSKSDGKIIGGGDIVTDDEFENFDLKLQWKIAKNGNSGIMFYVHEDTVKYKASYETGPEMQVLDNDGHPDGKIIKHRAGDLYDLISCSKETVRPVGEWNDVEIKCLNGKLDLYLNGENVVSTTLWDDNWKKMVAGSKFKQWQGFGSFKKGKICLQDHGCGVWYRNIKIKKL